MKRAIILFIPLLTMLADILPSSPDAVLHFADRLWEYSEYRRAATEYLRYYSLYSDRSDSERALFRAALSLELNGEYSSARNFYNMLGQSTDNRLTSSIVHYRTANTFYQENMLDTALAYIDAQNREMALEYLKGFTLLRQREYVEAGQVFSQLSELGGDLSPSILYMVSKSRQGAALREKSPITAGILSTVIPGLGRGYTGNWGDCLFSFLTVGVTIGPAVYFYDDDRTFSIVTGIVGAFFYFGNIYGSANGAVNYNNSLHNDFIRGVEDGVPHPPSEINRDLP